MPTKKGKKIIVQPDTQIISKKISRYVWAVVCGLVVFLLIKYAIYGVLLDLFPNNKCYVDYIYSGFASGMGTGCYLKIFGINIVALDFGIVGFVATVSKKAKEKKLSKKKNKDDIKNLLPYVWAALTAIIVFFLVRFAIRGTTYHPLSGCLCPMDWGPGSANWACNAHLAKMKPIANFITMTIPAFFCGLIAFVTLYPKKTKYHKLIYRSLIITAIIAFVLGRMIANIMC